MNTSKGEHRIAQILNKAGIMYQREKTFIDCKRGRYRYDFYLPNYNTLIEFHGEQHYHHVTWFHKTRTEFLKAQERDRQKCSYALANDIALYIVPYWDYDIINNISDIIKDSNRVRSRWHVDNSTPKQ